jgi:acetylornithine deacetylase
VTATAETVLDLLDALVRIDSVNPGLDASGAGEEQIAVFVAEWGRRAGLRVTELRGTPGRPSVILRGGRDQGGRRLLLCGHLDTVGLAGSADAVTPCVEGDRLYARGAYDMKAGLAAALIACRDASDAGIGGEVIVAAVADEELASLGVQEVLTQLDPASVDAAVLAAGHHLVAFDHLDQELRGRPDPFLGPGNLHASLIIGGTEQSTIPDRCVFTVERRTLPGETLERVEADVADLIERCRPADPWPRCLTGPTRPSSPRQASPPCSTDRKATAPTPTSNGSAAPAPAPPAPSSPGSPRTSAPESPEYRLVMRC